MDELSPELRRDVKLFLTKGVLKNVPFLANASDDLMSTLVCKLFPLIVPIATEVIKAGDVGDVMYFLDKGEVEVELVADDSCDGQSDVICFRLGEGSFFGEIALLSDDSVRTSTVRSTKTCELFTLSRGDFKEVVKAFPSFEDSLSQIAKKRRRRSARNIDLNRERSAYLALMGAINLGSAMNNLTKGLNTKSTQKSPSVPSVPATDSPGDNTAIDVAANYSEPITPEIQAKQLADIMEGVDMDVLAGKEIAFLRSAPTPGKVKKALPPLNTRKGSFKLPKDDPAGETVATAAAAHAAQAILSSSTATDHSGKFTQQNENIGSNNDSSAEALLKSEVQALAAAIDIKMSKQMQQVRTEMREHQAQMNEKLEKLMNIVESRYKAVPSQAQHE